MKRATYGLVLVWVMVAVLSCDKFKGPQGDPGSPGIPGPAGTDGTNGTSVVVVNLPVGDSDCPNGGVQVDHLKVCNGLNGSDGSDGVDGAPGSVVYSLGITQTQVTCNGFGFYETELAIKNTTPIHLVSVRANYTPSPGTTVSNVFFKSGGPSGVLGYDQLKADATLTAAGGLAPGATVTLVLQSSNNPTCGSLGGVTAEAK